MRDGEKRIAGTPLAMPPTSRCCRTLFPLDLETPNMSPSLPRLVGNCLTLVALCLALEAPAAGDLKTALAAVRVPSSDLELVANAAQSQNTPFNQQMKELKKEFEQDMDAEAMAMGKKVEELMKSIGITEDSLNYVLGSLSIRSIDPQAETPTIPGLIAFAVKTPLVAGKIAEGVTKFAADEGATIELKESSYKEIPVLSVVFDPANLPEDIDEEAAAVLSGINLALPAGGSVVYIGQTAQVQAGIDRMLAGESTPRSAGLLVAKALVPEKADGYLIFDMPDAFRQMMATQAQNAAGNPMAAGPMMALAGLKGAAISSVTSDKASMALAGDFETPENAMQLKVALDMMVGMMKMQLMNMTAGKPMPVIESIKTSTETTKATLSFELTVQDIRSFMELAKAARQPVADPVMAPGAAPVGVPAP